MTSTKLTTDKTETTDDKDSSRLKPLNSRRYFYIILGYYLFTIYIRKVAGEASFGSPHDLLREGEPADEHGITIVQIDFERVETPFIIALWIFCASLAKIVFHMAPKLSHIFPESCLLIVVGIAIGLLLFNTSNPLGGQPLTPDTFFFYMLPPIILDAGYFMPNRLFFSNLGTILLFAVVGTLWNTFAIGASLWGLNLLGMFGPIGLTMNILHTFLFSALISAVDPVAVLAVFEEIHVNEILYIVVFGESLLNDAVTVVLYHTFENFVLMGEENVTYAEVGKGIVSFPVVALGGTAIGIIWGFLTGFVTRFTNHTRVIEPIFVFVMAYLSYLTAETFHMSGILAITFCGITMKNYVEANISQKSHTTVKYAMKMLSSSSETIIFMFLGVSTINDNHEWNFWFIFFTIVFCTLHRSIGVVILTALANHFRLNHLGAVDQFVMCYGGLRGAVAFALALLIPEHNTMIPDDVRNMFITTTICVVFFTVFVQGMTIKPLVKWLKVARAEKRKPTMSERIHERLFDHTMSAMQSILGTYGHYNLRAKIKHIDNTYIRPCLVRDHMKGAEPKILETYSKLTMKDAIDLMQKAAQNGSVGTGLNKMTSQDSMATLLRNNQFESGNNLAGSSGGFQQTQDSWNLDLQELEYSLTKKDMSDAKIHHLLAEELYKPSRRQRRLSYSRHAVDETDLGESSMASYRQPIQPKKMVTRRRPGRPGRDPGRDNGHVTFDNNDDGKDNPSFNLVDERFQRAAGGRRNNDDGGIYFIAGPRVSSSSRKSSPKEDLATTPVESTLPWKRDEEDGNCGVRQEEFPAWSSNKDYVAYNSPSNTFLGGLDRNDRMPTVIGLFNKRDSVTSSGAGSRRGSVQSQIGQEAAGRLQSPRHSIGSSGGGSFESGDMSVGYSHGGNQPTSPSALSRRGSQFGVSIPEEVTEETDHDLMDIESKKSSNASTTNEQVTSIQLRRQGHGSEEKQEDQHTTQTKL